MSRPWSTLATQVSSLRSAPLLDEVDPCDVEQLHVVFACGNRATAYGIHGAAVALALAGSAATHGMGVA